MNLWLKHSLGFFFLCACASPAENPPNNPKSTPSPTVIVTKQAPEITKDDLARLELTVRVDSFLKVGNLLEPPEACAYPYLKEALGRFPEDPEVKRLKAAFMEALTKELDASLQKNKQSKAVSAFAILEELGADKAMLEKKRADIQGMTTVSTVSTSAQIEATKEERKEEAAQEYKLGTEELTKGNMAEAKKHFEKALTLQPTYNAARLGLARVAFQEGSMALAAKYASDVLKSSPSNVDALVILGDAHFRSYDYKRALEAYKKALAISPGSVQAQRGEKNAKKALAIE